VKLSWNAPTPTSDPIAGYHVYRTAAGGSNYAALSSSVDTQTTYTDTTVQSGNTYDYVVKSVDKKGVESAPSNATAVTVP
jgi:fibronectin type 3 domain-containing protein